MEEIEAFPISCPLIPLLPDGEKYPKDYQLPLRQRPQHSLDIAYLVDVLQKESIFDLNYQNSHLSVIAVLSPYSLLNHVMITELSPNRYLPSPTSFTSTEFSNITELTENIILLTKQDPHNVQCIGYNCSPYSWGIEEEKGGCQSIMTKFHLMIWQWGEITNQKIRNLSSGHKLYFSTNTYNIPFARLLHSTSSSFLSNYHIFSTPTFTSRGLFLPFTENSSILTVLRENDFLYNFSHIIEGVIDHLNECLLSDDSIHEMKTILETTSSHVLTEEERITLRKNPKIRTFDEAIKMCKCENEKNVIEAVYESALNRATKNDPSNPLWKKYFGYSLAVVDSKQNDVCKSGLYVGLHALCIPGGVAELVGCYLTRPEQCLADEEIMMKHNHLLWKLSDGLNKLYE
ncbi:hypothetical protein GPJ56_004402 [Histomonas meleagridis]|uniref:uncharacterized protein n=1 Tax=Histomonas meleagridis TaxID=135588 RepID=UPI0035594727|nr:hypothetical protein GPJ56_004402 [Histomonas meleagridis]KAH0799954.1 hypothetical protein GO595_007066 [Histomonas meleagridis]